MKKAIALVLLPFLVFCACSKQSSPPIPVPPVIDTTVVNSGRLLKTILTNSPAYKQSNLDSFAYDNAKRVSYYSQYWLNASNSATVIFEYQFLYAGSNPYPLNYTVKQTTVSVLPNPNTTITSRDTLIYNTDNKLIMDSTVFCSVSGAGAPIKTKRYSYYNNLLVARTLYPNNTANNSLDSTFFDGNENTVQRTLGSLDKNNTYTRNSLVIITYTSSLNPFKTNAAGIVYYSVYGVIPTRHLQASTTRTYINNTTPVTDTDQFEWIKDINGLLQKMNDAGSNAFTNSTALYTYY
jgi:hypothetical protein